MDDDELYETPPVVIGSIAAGIGPVPFLGIYAVLFLSHGLLYPVSPPDITSSRTGEAIAGFIALALFFAVILTIWWFLTRRRRWPFVLGQAATFVTAVDFVFDPTTGSPVVSMLLALTSLTALVLAVHPASWRHMASSPRRAGKRRAAPDTSAPKRTYVGRRRREPVPATELDDQADSAAD